MGSRHVRRTARGRLGAVLLAAVLVAAACTSDDGDDGADPAETSAPPTQGATSGAADTTAPAVDDDSVEADAGDSGGGTAIGGDCIDPDPVSLQLEWVVQAEFAGYFAAKDLGFYADQCIAPFIITGGPGIDPIGFLEAGGADFAVSWVPSALQKREGGIDVVNIAQIYRRSATVQVAFADSEIASVTDFVGKRIGTWGGGFELEMEAALRLNGIDPAEVEFVPQNVTMNAFLNGEIDAAQAMIYNEYALVLESVNPETGDLYQPDELLVIDWDDIGTAMLQSAIWADGARLADDPAYLDLATRFVEASLRGWIHCRDNPEDCVDIILDNRGTIGRSHQAWMMNEVNPLIWPTPTRIGVMNVDQFAQTVDVATAGGILTVPPDAGAFRTDIAERALAAIEADGIDTIGEGYTKGTVILAPGGR